MKGGLSAVFVSVGRRRNLIISPLAVFFVIVLISVWAIRKHSRIDVTGKTDFYADCDERLTLKRADGREFDVNLTGVRMKNGTIVPYDIALLGNDPPLTVFFEDVHYVARSGEGFELISIDDPPSANDAATNTDQSLGPAGSRIGSKSNYIVVTDRHEVAEFGKMASFVVPLAGGGTSNTIEIVTPYSLVKRIQQGPVEYPF